MIWYEFKRLQVLFNFGSTGQNINRKFESQSWFLHLTCLKEWGDGKRYHLKPNNLNVRFRLICRARNNWRVISQKTRSYVLYGSSKNVAEKIMSIIIKRWADSFLYALLFKFASRNLDAQHPDWCWSNKNARAIDFISPPLLKEQNYGQSIFFDQQQRHLLVLSEINFKLLLENVQHWSLSSSCKVGLQKRP